MQFLKPFSNNFGSICPSSFLLLFFDLLSPPLNSSLKPFSFLFPTEILLKLDIFVYIVLMLKMHCNKKYFWIHFQFSTHFQLNTFYNVIDYNTM